MIGCRFVLALTALLVLPATARADGPLRIRIAWTTVPGQMTPVVMEKKDLLDHLGKTYTVEHLHFSGSGPMVTALAVGEVDIAPLAPSSLGVAIQNAGLDDLRIIADDYQDGVADHYSSEFMVRADGPLQTIDDLKGKVLAVNAIGGGSDIALRIMLRRHGLEDKRDYAIVETQFPNMPAMLEQSKVDLAALVAPFSQLLKSRGTARTLFAMRDVLGPTQSLMNVARASYLEQNRAALQDFFEDYLRGLRWFLDPANRDEAVGIVAQFNRQPVAVFADYLFTNDDYYRDRDGNPNLDALQNNLRVLREVGFLDIDIDATRHADLSFIAEARRRLK